MKQLSYTTWCSQSLGHFHRMLWKNKKGRVNFTGKHTGAANLPLVPSVPLDAFPVGAH